MIDERYGVEVQAEIAPIDEVGLLSEVHQAADLANPSKIPQQNSVSRKL